MSDSSLMNAETNSLNAAQLTKVRLLSEALPGSTKDPLVERWKQLPAVKSIEVADPLNDALVRSETPQKTPVEIECYVPSDELVEAVDVALTLGRPLLLQGDPGCGKTRLAHAVAYALGEPLEECYIKSTSQAQDLLYRFDAVRRLYDAQTPGQGVEPVRWPAYRTVPRLDLRPRHYVRLGPLGRAIVRASLGRPSVVLIDEIDKADLDFPNDLLYELDRMSFTVDEAPELSCRLKSEEKRARPLVIITNNEEKTLPPAFLRRCIYHYVAFPETRLGAILEQHRIELPTPVTDRAIEILLKLREMKPKYLPGLSELIELTKYAQEANASPDDLLTDPYAGIVLKQKGDLDRAWKAVQTALKASA